jgi:type III pantothenate kinase
MYALIGDIGNTVTKICLLNIKKYSIKKIFFLQSRKLKNNTYIKNEFHNIIRKNKINYFSLFSSVVPKHEAKIRKFLFKSYKINLVEIKNKKINKIIKVNVKNKKQIGSDRIANAVSVYKKYKKNCIVLDLGTATTFDVVTKNGIYNGGVIAPGVNLSIKSLSKYADQIPYFSFKKSNKIIGKNTIEALNAGFYWGYVGLINNIIFKIEKETRKKYKILFSGGYADLFKTSIVRSFTVDKNITINGIIEIFKHNKNYLIK